MEISIEEQAKIARREYYREYRAKNPDRVRETNRRYWERRAIRIAEERKAEQATAESYNKTQTEV